MQAIFATDKHFTLHKNGKLLWQQDPNLKEECQIDLNYFHYITATKTIVMGRKTFQSLPFIPYNRHSIVLTNSTQLGYSNKYGNAVFNLNHTYNTNTLDEGLIKSLKGYPYPKGLSNTKLTITNLTGVFSLPKHDQFICIGGKEVLELLHPFVDTIHLTRFNLDIQGTEEERLDPDYFKLFKPHRIISQITEKEPDPVTQLPVPKMAIKTLVKK